MTKALKPYLMQFIGVIALYIATLFVSVRLLNSLRETQWRFPASFLPIIPIILGVLVFTHFFGQLDELQKKIQLYALAFSFCASGLLTFSYGLLQNAGLPQVSFIAVFPAMIALWGLGSVIAIKKYE